MKEAKLKRLRPTDKIQLSDQYGLNPSISVCFFCGQNKGIVALGKLKDDAKAPMHAVYDYEPCSECANKMKRGVAVIEVTTTNNQTAPIQSGAWPTGRWCVISKSAAVRLFKNTTRPRMLLEDTLYERLVKKNDH